MPAESAAKPLEKCPYCGADHGEASLRCPATDMVLPLAGRLLAGKFRLLSELGRGGMGAVWLASNIHVERDVALKLILPEVLKNPEIVARFRDEARVAARIGHAGICDILDFELTSLGPVIVMELLRGENLGQRISRVGRLPVAFAVDVVCQALVALDAAHRAGIIHRDLKPENLFLHQPGEGPMVVKLMDFGISKFTDRASGLTGSGVIMGTPEYMAPEQIHGAANADARTDIWAIGAVLYKALTGEEPFTGHSVPAIMVAITVETPKPITAHVPELPASLAAVVQRCLARAPADRYQSAREFAAALEPFKNADQDIVRVGSLPTLHSGAMPMPVAVIPPTVHSRAPAPTRSRWPGRLFGLALLTACGYGTWRYATQRPDLARPDPTSTAQVSAPAIVPTKSGTPVGARGVAHEASEHSPGLLALWGLLDPDAPGNAKGAQWLSTGLDTLAITLAQPLPIPTIEPTPDEPAETSTTGATTSDATGAGEGSDEPGTGTSEPPDPSGDPAAPAGTPDTPAGPEPPRLITAGGHVTPSVTYPVGNQHWAKEVCAALDRNKFLGIDRWKLANPTQARLFAGVAGIKPGSYWTTANHKGVGLVVSLPSGRDRSVASRKKTARPLCVATQ